jgi:hypothetical protein
VTEVLGFEHQAGTYRTQDLFVRRYTGTDDLGRVGSELVSTGVALEHAGALEEHGLRWPHGATSEIVR